MSVIIFFVREPKEVSSPKLITKSVNLEDIQKSMVNIVEKTDMEIYRKDPYHFFDSLT
jgi:hypothetical protein